MKTVEALKPLGVRPSHLPYGENMKIVKAAVKVGDKIYECRRHAEGIAAAIRDGASRVNQDEQGFITDEGTFVSRWKAARIAFKAGQTKEIKNPLMSEHLW